jgi:hypothetical protein
MAKETDTTVFSAKEKKDGVVITINVPVVYMARGVMILILMRAISFTQAIGRGGP